MTIHGAVIIEQGVTFAIISVRPSNEKDPSVATTSKAPTTQNCWGSSRS